MCSQSFQQANFNANPLNILVHLLLRLHNVYQSKVLLHMLPFGHNLKGSFKMSQSKAHPRLPTTYQYTVLLYLRPLGLRPPPPKQDTPLGGSGWTQGVEMVPIGMSSPHSYSTSIHTLPIEILTHIPFRLQPYLSSTVLPKSTSLRDRQTDIVLVCNR